MASAEVILLDEINRIPLKSQSAFLEALQDRTITVGKKTYELPTFSFAIATMNPVELGQGTFPLSEAATDRFAAMVNIGYLPPEEEEKLVNFDFKQVRLNPLLSKERIIELRGADQPGGVPARSAGPLHSAAGGGDAAVQPRHRLAARTRRRSSSSAASTWAPRRARSSAGAGWPRCGRCCSARRAEVYPEDIQDLAPFVLGHRIWLGPHAAAHGLTAEAVIRRRDRPGAGAMKVHPVLRC